MMYSKRWVRIVVALGYVTMGLLLLYSVIAAR